MAYEMSAGSPTGTGGPAGSPHYNNGFTGFNEEEVVASITRIINAYNSFYESANNTFQSSFVDGMSNLWACNDAIEFFTDAKSKMDSIINNANAIFESVVNSMNSAASAWAVRCKSTHSNVSISINPSSINTSSIQENIGGVRGIDLSNAQSTAKSALTMVSDGANTALTSAQNAVAVCGFLGGNQASNLQSSLDTIKNSINNVVNSLSDSLNGAIANTVEEYGNVEMNVSNAFAGTEG